MWARAKAAVLMPILILTFLQFTIPGENDTRIGATSGMAIRLVSLSDSRESQLLKSLGIETIADYNNGLYLARGTETGFSLLSQQMAGAKATSVKRTISFPASGFGFDTSGPTPAISPALTATATNERIVQFLGPIKSEWIEKLESLGLEPDLYVDGFAFIIRASEEQMRLARDLAFVNWVGTYEPAYKIQTNLLSMTGTVPISVVAHRGVDEQTLKGLLVSLGSEVITASSMPTTVEARIDSSMLPTLARSQDVLGIFWSPEREPADWASGEIHGFHEAWSPLRSGIPWNLTGRSPGPDGIQGNADDIIEIVGIQDTGFEANTADLGWDDLFSGPQGDRVINLRRHTAQCSQPDGFSNGFAHGIVVVGAVLSNGFDWEYNFSLPTNDSVWDESEAGVVPEGQLSFDCVGQGGGLATSPTYWDDEYADGARTFSNSYGSMNRVYDPTAMAVDARTDASSDRMVVFAVTNAGPYPNTVSGMAKGKNGLAIGASQNYRPGRLESDNPNMMADFSSRGNPTERFKPDLVTTGTSVVTGLGYREWQYYQAAGGGFTQPDYITEVDANHDGTPEYRYYTGTSVSTPQAAGMYMLTREYLREAHGIENVSSQLAKALLINGAVRMDPNYYDYPGIDQGWGRVDLEQSLFPPPPRSNQFEEGLFTTTGTWTPSTINLNIQTSSVPLKTTLVWIDQAGASLVRDLDLIVRDPSGTHEYHGNRYASSGPLKGWTDPSDSGYDAINNVEQVEIQSPTAGLWTVQVRGTSIPSTAPFALVFSGDVGPTQPFHVGLSTDSPAVLEVAPGGAVALPFDVRNFGPYLDTISISHDAPPGIGVSFDWSTQAFNPVETRNNLAVFTAASNASAGPHHILLCGTSMNDTNILPSSDCISLFISVDVTDTPPEWDVTASGDNEMDPSVVTFTYGGLNHIFIAYRKATPLNRSDSTHGGTNIWVAHNTVNSGHMPNGTWTYMAVSEWNDLPKDLRLLEIDNGTFSGRVVLTWTGEDPNEPDPDLQPYGRVAFSDPPYDDWQLRTIQKNFGSNVYNPPRTNFALFRRTGPGSNGTLVWVWEHLDSTGVEDLQTRAVQIHAAFSKDGGNSWGNCFSPDNACYRIAPGATPDHFFFPAGVVDRNDVLWVFLQMRASSAGQNRKLAAVLWDGLSWNTSWAGPITIWDSGGSNSTYYPSAASTPEGGNRVYVAVTRNNATEMAARIFTVFAEGVFGAGTIGPPPSPAPADGVSPDFSFPQGPMAESVLSARWGTGPALNMVYSDDGVTWIPYAEKRSGVMGGSDLATWHSSDGFVNRTEVKVTENPRGKGHAMADSLTIGARSCVYEVWHESKNLFEESEYDIKLAIYGLDWAQSNDTMGPRIETPAIIPNPFSITTSSSLEVLAQINDVSSGYSNITAAEFVPTDPSINDPSMIDWADAWTVNLTGVNRSPTETARLWANDTALSWPLHSCHRFWMRGQDSRGNWGDGSHVDVCVVAEPVLPWASSLRRAELTGPSYENVTLTWDRSLDDGGGFHNVVKYKVSRSESLSGPFLIIDNVTATGASSYSWTDVGAGQGDLHQYFYRVIANATYGENTLSKTGAKFHRAMGEGKQLLSFPLLQIDYAPEIILQTLNYTYARTYLAGASDAWCSFQPGRSFNCLSRLRPEEGYWVDLDGPGTMTVAGIVADRTLLQLRSGWNLIGFPSFTGTYTFADLDADTGGLLQLVEAYDPGAGPYYLKKVLRRDWPTTYLAAGYAYMVRVSSDVSWMVPGS